MKKNGSTSEKEEWRRLEGKNPTKWHWEKGSWRWVLDKIEALQNGSGIFICFIKSWMRWFDHFLTKLAKYWWIKTGDRHYHFVEPWVIDRPFCRMEIVYQSNFVETGVGSLQNGAPQPPQGMGRRIYIYIHIYMYIIIHIYIYIHIYTALCPLVLGCPIKIFPKMASQWCFFPGALRASWCPFRPTWTLWGTSQGCWRAFCWRSS